MIELPISIVAWLAVVIVQAVIHFIVFGARRERIQKEEEEAMFETLSLSTSESFSELDASQTDLPSIHRFEDQMVAAAVAAAAASSSSLLVDAEEEEEDYIILPAERMTTDPSDLLNSTFASILDEDDDDDSIMTPSPYSLMQTGKDILRVSFHIVVWKRFFCDFTLPLFSPNVLSLPLIISALFLGKCY
jgi:hypothetical protein